MQKEKIQEFSTRVVQSNPTELIVILYEMVQEEIRSAISSREEEDDQAYDYSIQQTQRYLQELMRSLDLRYSLSGQLLSIYRYVYGVTVRARLRRETEELESCIGILEHLRKAYEQVARQDSRGPVMKNAQKVYAGLTYGKNSLSEVSVDDSTGKRGLYA